MTVKECYALMNADYEDALHRFNSNERIEKFLGMLLRDDSYANLCAALKDKEYDVAFAAAHTLKGTSLNMSLTQLAKADAELTELLRHQADFDQIQLVFQKVTHQYEIMQSAVSALLEKQTGNV